MDAESAPVQLVVVHLEEDRFSQEHRFQVRPTETTPRPLGGSFVIFTLTCITATGKCGLGFDVSHSRKLSCTWSGLKSSTMRSKVGSQDTQVAVLQQHPAPVFGRFLNEFLGDGALALA